MEELWGQNKLRISAHAAQRIVTDLSEIVQEDINLMDENSVIIASTNPNRIGTLHGGSQKVISQKLEKLIINHEDEYEGSLPGLNIPIEVDEKIIGVIGITGHYPEIERYGKIIKRMTEILVLEDWRKEQQLQSISARNRFLNEWIFHESYCTEPVFCQRAQVFGIDVTGPWNIVVLDIKDQEDDPSDTGRQSRLEQVERALEQERGGLSRVLAFSTATKCIAMVHKCSKEQLVSFVKRTQQAVYKRWGLKIGAGIDTYGVDSQQVPQAYRRAEKALQASLRCDCQPLTYQDLTLEILIPELSQASKREFIEKIFKNCSQEERVKYSQLLKAYFACNGSIQEMGNRLFLHKNTVQYKLNKLKKMTGLDPRRVEEAALFYLAVMLMEDEGL